MFDYTQFIQDIFKGLNVPISAYVIDSKGISNKLTIDSMALASRYNIILYDNYKRMLKDRVKDYIKRKNKGSDDDLA